MKREMANGIDRRWRNGTLGSLGMIAASLWNFLSHTQRRLAALHARFAAGKLPAAPRRRATPTPRPAADRPRPEPPPSDMPRGPVFLEYGLGWSAIDLRALLDDPEMRALLAAAPQAGRILRPLWRKISPDPLPEALRLPKRPRRPRAPRAMQPVVARPAAPEATGRPAWWTYPVSLWADPVPWPSRRRPCLPGHRRSRGTDAAPSRGVCGMAE